MFRYSTYGQTLLNQSIWVISTRAGVHWIGKYGWFQLTQPEPASYSNNAVRALYIVNFLICMPDVADAARLDFRTMTDVALLRPRLPVTFILSQYGRHAAMLMASTRACAVELDRTLRRNVPEHFISFHPGFSHNFIYRIFVICNVKNQWPNACLCNVTLSRPT